MFCEPGVAPRPNSRKGRVDVDRRLLPERALTLGAALAFAVAMVTKLWGMVLVSTFYYDGLKLNIYATKATEGFK